MDELQTPRKWELFKMVLQLPMLIPRLLIKFIVLSTTAVINSLLLTIVTAVPRIQRRDFDDEHMPQLLTTLQMQAEVNAIENAHRTFESRLLKVRECISAFGFSLNVLQPARGMLELSERLKLELDSYDIEPLVLILNVHGDATGRFFDYVTSTTISGASFARGSQHWPGLLRFMQQRRRPDRRIYVIAAQCCSVQFVRDLEDGAAHMHNVFIVGLSSSQTHASVNSFVAVHPRWECLLASSPSIAGLFVRGRLISSLPFVFEASHPDVNSHVNLIAKIEMSRIRRRTDEEVIASLVADMFQRIFARI